MFSKRNFKTHCKPYPHASTVCSFRLTKTSTHSQLWSDKRLFDFQSNSNKSHRNNSSENLTDIWYKAFKFVLSYWVSQLWHICYMWFCIAFGLTTELFTRLLINFCFALWNFSELFFLCLIHRGKKPRENSNQILLISLFLLLFYRRHMRLWLSRNSRTVKVTFSAA